MASSIASLSLDQLSIDTLRLLAVDTVEKAKSGHPGAPLGCAPIAYLLFHKLMKHNPAHSKWADRDRFVLSNGHASALLYGTLFLSGYKLTLDDLKSFRQWGSKTPGHPEFGLTPTAWRRPPARWGRDSGWRWAWPSRRSIWRRSTIAPASMLWTTTLLCCAATAT